MHAFRFHLIIFFQEKDELCDKVRELSAGVENLQVSSKKLEEQEQKLVAVNLENNRILRQVQSLQIIYPFTYFRE